jgi:uncharacterized protein HemY
MKKIISGIIIFLLAIWLSLKFKGEYNYVLININNTKIETNIWFLLFTIIILCLSIKILMKFISLFFRAPSRKTAIEVKSQDVILDQIKNLVKLKKINEANRLIQIILKKNPDPIVLDFYPKIAYDLISSIKFMEKLDKKYKNNAYILGCLGTLYAKNKLWGQAKKYLDNSVAIKPLASTYAILGYISEKLSNKEQAYEYYKLCSQIITDCHVVQET